MLRHSTDRGESMRVLKSLVFLMLAGVLLGMPAASNAQIGVGVSIRIGPPVLPVYAQPICPEPGYIWTPGYWAYGDDDYYWVPGTWVMAPEPGLLWTPGYWGFAEGLYVWHGGYWGPHGGFYGGINYGYGYFGRGYEGGRWDNGHFFYNRAVNNVNVNVIHNVYNTRINNSSETRVSYNGGNGGVNARPTSQEQAAAHGRHIPPVAAQTQHAQAARSNPQMRASANHGKPPIAATPKPGAFSDRGAVQAREGGTVHTAGARPENNAHPANNSSGPTAVHPNELPPVERPAAPNTGNPKLDQKYQKQQEKLQAQQAKERQKIQQQQEKEHQQLARQNANEARKQQTEQRHQQQTQQMAQRHVQQRQQLEQRQQPSRAAAHPRGRL